jgi:hypothetical protein
LPVFGAASDTLNLASSGIRWSFMLERSKEHSESVLSVTRHVMSPTVFAGPGSDRR